MGLLGAIANKIAATAARKHANELEDILAGLIINGVGKDEIEIQHHPDRTVVVVRGEPRYELRTVFKPATHQAVAESHHLERKPAPRA